ncbi:MAG: AbrB/MazE/SpoVT family DNA-binding domain-containing protein, partial [Acidobacteria bacterium]|nr:AbrB/MazE/SpoVT family DNA-binding domain-containing protein [Acidobacteriota bacterium]
KSLIEQYDLKDEVILEARDDGLILRPVESPRIGWDKAFKQFIITQLMHPLEGFIPSGPWTFHRP